MNLLKKCLGILYPQTCYFCGKICVTPMCSECAKKITYIDEPRCKKCGKPIRYEEKEYCSDCEQQNFCYEQGRSLWLHKGPVKWSIYQFKYKNHRVYAEYYARELYRIYGQKIKAWSIDVIIPVPLHWKRRRKRGYNQAEMLAKELGRISGIRVETRNIKRIRETKPQKEMNHKQRKRNVRDAFRVTKRWKGGGNVLLIDDIYTTGNTIDAVARKLKEKGASKVMFLTISIGQGF